MDDKNTRIRYCASVLSIPKKIIECGPLIVKNYKIKCDNNFEPFWYKIHINDDVEKLRKIEKEIIMNKYCIGELSYNSGDEMYYKQMYDDEPYLFHGEKLSDVLQYNDTFDKSYIENDEPSYNEMFYNEYNEYNEYNKDNNNKENENKKKRNVPVHIPSLRSMENLKRKNSLNTDKNSNVNLDNDTKKSNKIKITKKINNNNDYDYDYDDSNNDSYDDWSSPNFSDEEKTDEKKIDNNELLDDYYDDYIY